MNPAVVAVAAVAVAVAVVKVALMATKQRRLMKAARWKKPLMPMQLKAQKTRTQVAISPAVVRQTSAAANRVVVVAQTQKPLQRLRPQRKSSVKIAPQPKKRLKPMFKRPLQKQLAMRL